MKRLPNRLYINFILILFLPVLASAQPKLPDSAKDSLKFANTDSVRYFLQAELAIYYLGQSPKASLYYFEQCIPLCKNHDKTLSEADALGAKGYLLLQLGNLPGAFACLQDAEKLASDPENENKSWHYSRSSEFPPGRLPVLARIYLDLAELMGATGNTDQEMVYLQKTKSVAGQAHYTLYLGLGNLVLAGIYLDLNKLDLSLECIKKAEDFLKKTNYKKYSGAVYQLSGIIYMIKGDNARALLNYHEAMVTNAQANNLIDLATAYASLCDYYLRLNRADSSLFYARKTLALRKAVGMYPLGNTYKNLYKSYKLNHQADSTFKYLELALTDRDIDFSQTAQSLVDFQKLAFKSQVSLDKLEKEKALTQYEVKIYLLCAALTILILLGLVSYRNNRQKRNANRLLREQKEEIEAQRDQLENALQTLKTTQNQLIIAEKMASLGELTAGIAHEIQNPLNFVNNFSEVNGEIVQELIDELKAGKVVEAIALAGDLCENETKINFHGRRADSIVKGMLAHSRSASGRKELTDLNKLAEEHLTLAYHSFRAKDKSVDFDIITNFDKSLPEIEIVPQDIGRVLINLFNNAFYALKQKQNTSDVNFKPSLEVTTSKYHHSVQIVIKDNGTGIPDQIKDKIMQPFFTTKPTGEGTGLGLSLSYDIVVKGHGGNIAVNTAENEYTEFILVF